MIVDGKVCAFREDNTIKVKRLSVQGRALLATSENSRGAGLQKQEEIAVACGYEYVDFLLLGRRLLRGDAPATAEGEMSRESAIIVVTALVDQMVAAEEKLSLWRTASSPRRGSIKKDNR